MEVATDQAKLALSNVGNYGSTKLGTENRLKNLCMSTGLDSVIIEINYYYFEFRLLSHSPLTVTVRLLPVVPDPLGSGAYDHRHYREKDCDEPQERHICSSLFTIVVVLFIIIIIFYYRFYHWPLLIICLFHSLSYIAYLHLVDGKYLPKSTVVVHLYSKLYPEKTVIFKPFSKSSVGIKFPNIHFVLTGCKEKNKVVCRRNPLAH
ncbi:hypothetical protein AGLY_011815 [Aphis glycines]|uniref:Uncharacterized protein n=1 Tax=Aphis glycines TaxID=307491 RepID=A0A6G0TB99_APHGL|nr:hypothetical protein AGLY_011815 [Aphis glycines]